MTARRRKIHPAIAVAILCLGLAACASAPPPLTELADAESALARAHNAGAADAAPVELQFAQDKLKAARDASAASDQATAAILARQATVDAELAAAKARAARAREGVRAQTEANLRLRTQLLGDQRP